MSKFDKVIDLGVVVDLPENTDFIDLNVKLFHYADKIDTSFEPKCISWKDYKSHPSASILSEIIRTGIDVISASNIFLQRMFRRRGSGERYFQPPGDIFN